MNTDPSGREEVSVPPLHVILDVAEAAAELQRLLYLDRAWTAAERHNQLGERDRERLSALGNSLDTQLAQAERLVDTLSEFFDSHRSWVNDRVRNELASDHFTATQREEIQRLLAAHNEDFAGRGRGLTASFGQRVQAERVELRKKIQAVRRNGDIRTDISHELFCNLAAGGIIADLAVCVETAGVGCAAALAIYALAVHEGC